MHRHFAGLFIDADFSHLRRIRICRRRSHAGAFVLATAGFLRGRIGSSPAQCSVEVNRGHNRLLEGHPILRPFVFPLLL